MHLPIVRPVSVSSIRYASASSTADFIVTTDSGIWRASAIINATGTWNNPVLPHFHGSNSFTGEQLHARNYVSSEAFAQKKVAIVGGGISAVQLLEEISRTTEVLWYTRREPVFMDGAFRAENEGREVIRKVTSEAEQGNPQRSVVSYGTDLDTLRSCGQRTRRAEGQTNVHCARTERGPRGRRKLYRSRCDSVGDRLPSGPRSPGTIATAEPPRWHSDAGHAGRGRSTRSPDRLWAFAVNCWRKPRRP